MWGAALTQRPWLLVLQRKKRAPFKEVEMDRPEPCSGTQVARRRRPGASTQLVAGLTLFVLLLTAAGASAAGASAAGASAPAWTAQTSGTTADLNSVCFADAAHGWATGDNGVVVATVNGGSTWGAQTSGTTSDLYGVSFASDSQGYAVGAGGTIVATTDGGATWVAQDSGTNLDLLAVSCGGPTIATGNGQVLFPLGTNAWSQVSGVPTPPSSMSSVVMSDDTGFMCGPVAVVYDTGGMSTSGWGPCSDPLGVQLSCVTWSFAGGGGWVVGGGGAVFAGYNLGQIYWQSQPSGTTADLNGVSCIDTTNCWVVGDGGFTSATWTGGSYGGWNTATSGTSQDLNAVTYLNNPQVAWVVGDGGTILQWQSAATLAYVTRSDGGHGDVAIQLCATRGTLPAWQTRWRVDGGRWQVGNLLTLRRPGTSHVQYYSVDTAGLHEIVRKLAVRIVR